MAVRLIDRESGVQIGEISREQLADLQEALEEEFEEDHDYFITADTLDYLREQGIDAGLVERLRAALGSREGFEVYWSAEA